MRHATRFFFVLLSVCSILLAGCPEEEVQDPIDYLSLDYQDGWFSGWETREVFSDGFIDAVLEDRVLGLSRNPDVETNPNPSSDYYLYDLGYNFGWSVSRNSPYKLAAGAAAASKDGANPSSEKSAVISKDNWNAGWEDGWDICDVYGTGFEDAFIDRFYYGSTNSAIPNNPDPDTDPYYVYDKGYRQGRGLIVVNGLKSLSEKQFGVSASQAMFEYFLREKIPVYRNEDHSDIKWPSPGRQIGRDTVTRGK